MQCHTVANNNSFERYNILYIIAKIIYGNRIGVCVHYVCMYIHAHVYIIQMNPSSEASVCHSSMIYLKDKWLRKLNQKHTYKL